MHSPSPPVRQPRSKQEHSCSSNRSTSSLPFLFFRIGKEQPDGSFREIGCRARHADAALSLAELANNLRHRLQVLDRCARHDIIGTAQKKPPISSHLVQQLSNRIFDLIPTGSTEEIGSQSPAQRSPRRQPVGDLPDFGVASRRRVRESAQSIQPMKSIP